MLKKLFLSFFIFLFTTSVFAFDKYDASQKFYTGNSAGFSTGMEYEQQDALLDLYLYGNFIFENFGFSLLAPLRVLIYDKNNDTETYFSVLPKRDWNSPRDFVSVLTQFYYGHPDERYYFYFGTFNDFSLGNGTILGHYFNTITASFPKRSLNIHLKTDYLGIKLITDDVVKPNILGGRIYLKPFAFIDKESYLNNLNLGFSFVYDIDIPETLGVSKQNNKKISSKYDNILGVDADFRVWQNLYYSATPKIALNSISFAGKGLHLGLEQTLNIFAINSSLSLETSFILGQSNYSPTYFDTFYDVDKLFYLGNNRKYSFLATKSFENLDLLHGFEFKSYFKFLSILDITASILSFQRYNFNEKNDVFKENYMNFYSQLAFHPVSFLDFGFLFAKNDINKDSLFDNKTRFLLRGSIDLSLWNTSLFSFYVANTFVEGTPKTDDYNKTQPTEFAYKSQWIFSLGGMAKVRF